MSARLTQVRLLPGELSRDPERFPPGVVDELGQQLDLRLDNSWTSRLEDVSTVELIEAHCVGAFAPFLLLRRLAPMLRKSPHRRKFVVNVTAREGRFQTFNKTSHHPHTNMTKAALNMLTLTSARDFADSQLFMNAVDTGWVTDEDPKPHADRKQAELDFHPPLDIVDGAARVVDPVFEAERTGQFVFGKFFKDYAPTAW